MDTNTELWDIAGKAALRVEFITTGRELYLYTNALYIAMEWGWRKTLEDKECERIKTNKLLKRE